MGRLKELFTKLKSGFGNMSKGRKIALGILLLGIIAATVIGVYTLGKTNYVALFDSVDSKDSKNILAKLDEKKVSYKVVDNKIMVPEDVAGELRLSLSSDITNGSIGFDIFDSSSQFGMTNEEFRVKYQRAIQGELEKTIKLYNEVENAKVNIVLPEDSTFVKDTAEASATVAIQLKQGVELDDEQVKGIISLVSFSVKNLPKKNVQVVDSNMRLLSEGLADDTTLTASGSVDKQLEAKTKIDNVLEKKILAQLEPIYGKGRIKANVNAVLDFDATKTETVTVDKDPAKVSEHTIEESNGSSTTTSSNSPVDNNMSTVTSDNTNNGSTKRKEVTTNYNPDGKKTENTVSAPGKIKRVTASVAIDSKDLDATTLDQIKELVNGTIGQINGNEDDTKVQAYDFNPTLKESVQSEFEKMQTEQDQANKMRLYLLIGLGIGSLLLSTIIFIIIRRRRKKVVHEEAAEEVEGIDAFISDIPPKQPINFAPIDFEEKNERTHLEEEIRKYATSKPDQVLDIVKSWMASDER